MGEETFKRHINAFRNDFASWLKDAFNEKRLADEICHVKERFELQRKLMHSIFEKLEELTRRHAKKR